MSNQSDRQPDLDFSGEELVISHYESGNLKAGSIPVYRKRRELDRFHPLYDPKFSQPEPQAHARRTDGPRSHEAAKSVQNISETQEQILRILRALGPLTDERIQEVFVGYCSPSGIRSRRAELVRMGKVRQSAREGRTAAGRACGVWEVVK
jgi:hypothetical protein